MAAPPPVILNVNDDAASRYLLSRVLRMAGFTVVEAGTGREALERVDASTDLVVLDVHLPDINGREVCSLIKQSPRTREVLVLHLSAVAVTADQRVAGLEGGADAYLTAPVAPEELVAQVNALLRLRRAEREVRTLSAEVERQRRLLELAISRTPDPVALLDREGRYLFFNPASRDAVEGRTEPGLSVRELASRVPELQAYAEKVEEALRTGEPQRGEVTLGRGPRARSFEYTASPAVGPEGVEAVMVTARDTTERRSGEEFREQFIGMLGHDLRNPLNAILLSAQQLQRRGFTEAQASLDARILSSARRMERMIHQLLDFARARLGGGIPVSRTPGDLFELCRRCVEELRASHPERLLVLEALGDGRGAWDVDRLEQVVGNLLANALKYGAEERPVRVTVEATGPEAVLRVHNEGPPIPPEELPRLFEPYRRGRVRTRERGVDTGLGLGLYITWHLVRAHGGTVEVTSTLEGGTAFTVRLPR